MAALPSNEKNAQAFGLMKIDDSGRIIDFAEKPKGDALRAMRVDTTILGLDAERCAARERHCCAGQYHRAALPALSTANVLICEAPHACTKAPLHKGQSMTVVTDCRVKQCCLSRYTLDLRDAGTKNDLWRPHWA